MCTKHKGGCPKHVRGELQLRATLHLEAGPIPLEVDCMKCQSFLGLRPASITHYNNIITGVIFPYGKALGLRG
jgi:hypothetical protein